MRRIGWIGIVAVVVIGWLGYDYTLERGRSEGRAQGLAQGQTQGLAQGKAEGLAQGRQEAAPRFVSTSDPLAVGSFDLASRAARAFKIRIDADTMREARVLGSFSVSGGNGTNAVRAHLFRETDYVNWQHRSASDNSPTNALFSTPDVTEGRVDASISEPGVYYLVFSSSAMLLSRTVRANVSLDYQKLKPGL